MSSSHKIQTIHSRITNDLKNSFYEGGKRTAANRDFYNANSEFENTATPDRDTLRARARWLHENNPIMASIDESIINNTIGNGIKLQSKTGKNKVDTEIEKRFKYWCKKENCDIEKTSTFFDIQSLALQSRMVDGEVFIYKIKTKEGLKLQLLEADMLDTSCGTNGITYDSNGAPKTYHFKTNIGKSQDIDASRIINYFKKERPTQKRGISEYKQAIIDIKNFSAFQTATIQAARARANVAYTVESDRDSDSFNPKVRDTSDWQNGDLVDINGIMVYYLRSGEELKSFDSSNGGENYEQFVLSALRLMGVARKVSYELAFRDYSHVNFSSGRMGRQEDHKLFSKNQISITDHMINDIFEEWLELEIDLGNMKTIKRQTFQNNKETYVSPKWIYPKREWIEPIKDLTSAQMEIDMGGLTASDFCAARGQDYEENLMTKRRELEKKKEILGEYYEEVVAIEQKNKDLLISTLQGDKDEDKN